MQELYLTAEEQGERIDRFLSADLEDLSRSYIQKLVKEGGVLVNGNPVKANYKVNTGDDILVRIPEPEPLDILPEDIPLDILYEDDDILVVNKPKGMVVHPAPGHYSHTLVNARASSARALQPHTGKCSPVSLRQPSLRDQRRATPGNRPSDR